eukprot:3064054-Amphidinium_carterae.2
MLPSVGTSPCRSHMLNKALLTSIGRQQVFRHYEALIEIASHVGVVAQVCAPLLAHLNAFDWIGPKLQPTRGLPQ